MKSLRTNLLPKDALRYEDPSCKKCLLSIRFSASVAKESIRKKVRIFFSLEQTILLSISVLIDNRPPAA